MIRTRLWRAGSDSPEESAWAASLTTLAELPAQSVLWVDLENPTPTEEAWAFQQFFPIHPLSFEDITKPRRHPQEGAHLPKVEEFADYLLGIVNPLPQAMLTAKPPRPLRGKHRPQLSVILSWHVLITHHYEPMDSIASAWTYTQRHPDSGRRGPDYLFHLILDAMVDEYAPIVEKLGEHLDRIERSLFVHPTPRHLQRLMQFKRRVSFLRKTLLLEQEVIFRLQRGDFTLVDERGGRLLSQCL